MNFSLNFKQNFLDPNVIDKFHIKFIPIRHCLKKKINFTELHIFLEMSPLRKGVFVETAENTSRILCMLQICLKCCTRDGRHLP
jgi:hypothetical protein